jgi:hypothetical protein
MRALTLAFAVAGLMLSTSPVAAQDQNTIETLGKMKSTGKGADWAPIPQTGDYAN